MSVTFTNWMPRRESTSAKSINSLRSAPRVGAGPRLRAGWSLGKGMKLASKQWVLLIELKRERLRRRKIEWQGLQPPLVEECTLRKATP